MNNNLFDNGEAMTPSTPFSTPFSSNGLPESTAPTTDKDYQKSPLKLDHLGASPSNNVNNYSGRQPFEYQDYHQQQQHTDRGRHPTTLSAFLMPESDSSAPNSVAKEKDTHKYDNTGGSNSYSRRVNTGIKTNSQNLNIDRRSNSNIIIGKGSIGGGSREIESGKSDRDNFNEDALSLGISGAEEQQQSRIEEKKEGKKKAEKTTEKTTTKTKRHLLRENKTKERMKQRKLNRQRKLIHQRRQQLQNKINHQRKLQLLTIDPKVTLKHVLHRLVNRQEMLHQYRINFGLKSRTKDIQSKQNDVKHLLRKFFGADDRLLEEVMSVEEVWGKRDGLYREKLTGSDHAVNASSKENGGKANLLLSSEDPKNPFLHQQRIISEQVIPVAQKNQIIYGNADQNLSTQNIPQNLPSLPILLESLSLTQRARRMLTILGPDGETAHDLVHNYFRIKVLDAWSELKKKEAEVVFERKQYYDEEVGKRQKEEEMEAFMEEGEYLRGEEEYYNFKLGQERDESEYGNNNYLERRSGLRGQEEIVSENNSSREVASEEQDDDNVSKSSDFLRRHEYDHHRGKESLSNEENNTEEIVEARVHSSTGMRGTKHEQDGNQRKQDNLEHGKKRGEGDEEEGEESDESDPRSEDDDEEEEDEFKAGRFDGKYESEVMLEYFRQNPPSENQDQSMQNTNGNSQIRNPSTENVSNSHDDSEMENSEAPHEVQNVETNGDGVDGSQNSIPENIIPENIMPENTIPGIQNLQASPTDLEQHDTQNDNLPSHQTLTFQPVEESKTNTNIGGTHLGGDHHSGNHHSGNHPARIHHPNDNSMFFETRVGSGSSNVGSSSNINVGSSSNTNAAKFQSLSFTFEGAEEDANEDSEEQSMTVQSMTVQREELGDEKLEMKFGNGDHHVEDPKSELEDPNNLRTGSPSGFNASGTKVKGGNGMIGIQSPPARIDQKKSFMQNITGNGSGSTLGTGMQALKQKFKLEFSKVKGGRKQGSEKEEKPERRRE